MRKSFQLLAAALLAAAPLKAQNHEAMHGMASDTARASVLAAVKVLFDGMRAGDSAMVRSAFHPNALMTTWVMRQNVPTVLIDSLSQFTRSVGTPHPEQWDERTHDEMVHIDQGMAMVWAPYAFYLGGKFSHCGVDNITLARTEKGWKIVTLMDTRQRTGCAEQK
jgi:hypothetical protein